MKFYLSFLCILLSTFNQHCTDSIVNLENQNSKVISEGVGAILNSTRNLFKKDQVAQGLNYLVDSVFSFYLVASSQSEITIALKQELEELITQFKYKITVLINGYFKPFNGEPTTCNLSEDQKTDLKQSILRIFKDAVHMVTEPEKFAIYLRDINFKLKHIVEIVASGNIDCSDFNKINDLLEGIIKSTNLHYREKVREDSSVIIKILDEIFIQLIEADK